ncbi:MAG: DedA family protein [Candidatus Omnitrophica bacterium]|nr:DedA family protein [Candidatus Omnitrophota bacterium]
MMHSLFDLLLHVDTHLQALLQQYGAWTYALLFLIVFCETGLVVTPFLPGDSLLFAAGVFSASGALEVWPVAGVLVAAAVLGDTVNYSVGSFLGPKVVAAAHGRLIRREHLERTHRFFERHGGKTIVLARFVPIVRTLAPFVAGLGRMTYGRFLLYNVAGGVVWVALFVGAGYLFHQAPLVRDHFSLVVLAIVVLSVLPAVLEWLRHRKKGLSPGSLPAGRQGTVPFSDR